MIEDREYQELQQIFEDLNDVKIKKKLTILELITYYIKRFIKHSK